MGSKQRRQAERDQAFAQGNYYIHELDSDDYEEDDIDIENIQQRRLVAGSSHFDGFYAGNGASGGSGQYLLENFAISGDRERLTSKQVALRDKEERLVQSALARIQRAEEKGKKDVKLHEDELKALERRRKQLKEAAKRKKDAGSSDKERRRSGRMITIPIPSPMPSPEPRSRRGHRDNMTASPRRSLPANSGPGIRYDGPEGTTYVPLTDYLPAGSPRMRSSSNIQYTSRPPRTPPSASGYRAFNPGRHTSEGNRAMQSASATNIRALPDDETWLPNTSPRTPRFHADPFDYLEPSADESADCQHPALRTSRRNVSGPASMQQPEIIGQQSEFISRNLAKGPYGGSPVLGSSSEPSLIRRRTPHKLVEEVPDSEEGEATSSEDSDDSVVFIEPPHPRAERKFSPSGVVHRKPVGSGIAVKKRGNR